MTSGCPAVSSTIDNSVFNVSDILAQRWEDSPKDDRKRLELCWGYQDCGDCHRSKGFCGWCPISGTCLPLPLDPLSRAFPLLSPTRYKFICATGPERFELRTSGLGCQVSTITFLTSIVTIFCTIAGLILLYGLVKLAKWIGIALRARKGGWVLYEDGTGEIWVRRGEGWRRWWQRVRGRPREEEVMVVDGGEEEVMVLDGGAEERVRWAWWGRARRTRAVEPVQDERAALLG